MQPQSSVGLMDSLTLPCCHSQAWDGLRERGPEGDRDRQRETGREIEKQQEKGRE